MPTGEGDLSMGSARRNGLVAALLAILAIGLGSPASRAQQPAKIRLTLEFRVYGGTAPSVLADARGYFRAANIEAKIDGGIGSGEAIKRVAGGAYDFGIADVGTLVEFNARNPDAAPRVVMLIFDTAAHAIVSLKRTGIATLADLSGHRLATRQSDAAARIFPSFARLNHLALDTVKLLPVDVRLRETMLLRGEADASMGYDYTVMFNLLGQNVPLDDLAVIDFTEYGFGMYGNALIASRAMIEDHPDLVRGVPTAVAHGWIDPAADP